MKLFFISIFAGLSLLAFVQPAVAQTNSTTQCDVLRGQFQNAGGSDIAGSLPEYCNTTSIYKKIVNILYYLIGIAATIAIIYGGYLYMTARGNAAQVAQARSVLTWAIIGLVIAILAAVIVNVVVTLLVENR